MASRSAKSAAITRPNAGPQPQYGQRSRVVTLPAPSGGWNTRDPIAEMPVTDAIVMDNLIPGNGDVQLRNGYTLWASGLSTYVESLMEYTSPTANKLFAASGTNIYDVTASGIASASGSPLGLLLAVTDSSAGGVTPVVTGLTNARWQHVNFGTPAGNYLVCCNGADAVRNFDGTTWTTPTLSGVGAPASTSLVNVNAHANRLWFIPNNSTSAWYLPTQSISGALTELPFGSYLRLGGHLVAMASWSQDGGSGMGDLACFISSKGEVVVCAGTDPSSTSWTQIGVFKIAPPLGNRCFLKAGSDLAVITEIGVVPMSKALSFNISAQTLVAFTDKISGAFRQYNTVAGSAFGWQFIEHPAKQLFIVNAPVAERQTQHQFVMNARTGAWCRFTNMNAGCWGRLGDDLFFGDNSGNVWKYSTQYSDNTATISAIFQQAYTDCGVPVVKRFVGARPNVLSAPGFSPTVQLLVDYDTSTIPAASSQTATTLPMWDTAVWNTSYWSPTSQPILRWQTVGKIGKVASPAMNFSAQQEIAINAMDLMYEPGGYF